MANTFNKYYLDNTGLQTLIAKIKANDNQLATLIGLPADWASTDTTADGFKSVISELTDAYTAADDNVKTYIEGLLGYNDENWPTKEVEGEQVKLTVDERLKGLSEAIADLAGEVDAVSATADNAFAAVQIEQDNAAQKIDITFTRGNEEQATISIDTTDFIVHGMLNDVVSVAIAYKKHLDVTAAPTYKVGDKNYVLPDNVLNDLFGKTTDITGADVEALDLNKHPLTYLVMTFSVQPDPNDGGSHEKEANKEIWVNVSNLVNQYEVKSGDLNLFTIDEETAAGGVVTYTITPSQTLQDGVQNSNQIWDLLTSSDDPLIYEENGEWKIKDIPTIPLDSAAVDNAWNETVNP